MDLQPKNFVPQEDLSKANKLKSDIEKENQYYQELLTRPLFEIIQDTINAKKAYEEQQQIMQMWILQQKAMQDLAFELGKKLNQDPKEIWNQAVDNMDKALNRENKNNLNGNISENQQEKFHSNQFYFYLKDKVDKLRIK